jgi:hypothetical protein
MMKTLLPLLIATGWTGLVAQMPAQPPVNSTAPDVAAGETAPEQHPVQESAPTRPVLPVINVRPLDAEGSESVAGSPNPATFLVTHDLPPTETVRFLFRLGGTATEGADYVVSPSANIESSIFGRWFVFPPGQVETEIVITPVDDLLIEGEETVTLSLHTPPFNGVAEGAGTGGGAPADWVDSFGFRYGSSPAATVTIRSNDIEPPPFALVSLAATDATGSEVPPSAGADPAIFTLTRTGSNLGAVTVYYSFVELPIPIPLTSPIPVMAENGIDFDMPSGSVTFAEGATTAEIVIHPIFDSMVETTENVMIALLPSPLPTSDPGSYVIDQETTAVARIVDYAPSEIPVITMAANDAQAVEDPVTRRTGAIIVRRQGSTEQPITVPYLITGTAVNGVDYVALPGSVTFPAGSSGVLISIEPINDDLAEGTESVGLTLLPPPPDLNPPPYLVGSPARAGVAIRDHLRSANSPVIGPAPATPSLERLPDGTVILEKTIANPTATVFIIDASTDLVHWQEIGTVTATESFADFVDLLATDLPVRFYRMRSAAAPPIP